MAKQPTLTNIASGFASQAQLNNNFDEIRNAFNNTISRDGSTPNAMQAPLDMNGEVIVNAGGLTINGVDVFTLLNRVTVSTAFPSGGQDGDVWFRVST
jgi:hypothetical protein